MAAALLVKVRGDGQGFASALKGVAGNDVQTILTVPSQPAGMGVAGAAQSAWLKLKVAGDANPWEQAHDALLTGGHGFGAADTSQIEAIEPDIEQQWPYADLHPDLGMTGVDEEALCTFNGQNAEGRREPGPGFAWHLGDEFSGLASAAAQVGAKAKAIRIAHLDTGFDAKHVTLPANFLKELQRNFVEGGKEDDARDQMPPGDSFFQNRGHGTATLGLLAGSRLDGSIGGWDGWKKEIGGAPLASIIPIRIADWVVRLKTSTMVQGFQHALSSGAHVLSMSMGGLSSKALVDAINAAYEAGVVMVTAAGNNFAGYPMPRSIVFPARYRRVLAATGVMADGRPYASLDSGTMQGNYGPASKMDTALAAYTPNVPWAEINCGKMVDMDGGGTSAATPQVAAAAALWLAEHWGTVQKYSQHWMRVEAVRRALFESAGRRTAKMNEAETREKLGRGALKAHKALSQLPAAESALSKLPPAEESWSWLNLIFGGGVSAAEGYSSQQQEMLRLELTQMAQRVAAIDEAIEDPGKPAAAIPAAQRIRYLEAALDAGNPSMPLRRALEGVLQRRATATVVPPSPDQGAPIRRRPTNPPPPTRRLRVFALDPSLGKKLDSLAINQTTLNVPWDDVLPWDPVNPDKQLKPGPVGEYLEVVDVDPASNRLYPPIDLNNRALLAQDGWPPSEGNPQFHQQMVYAVGMTTIGHFERALGRKALWAPYARPETRGRYEMECVQRLRIYPHAFRGSNAYYSPNKKALLFGYFPAESKDGDATPSGSMVFSCLSSDIIAHEMTHALLDGLHRRYEYSSNPDVPAFHEAFADIVALFQHFTIKELVRFEVARSRADLSAHGLLDGLAQQFGEGSSRGGPLRNYRDPGMQKLKYADTNEAHARGSILVYAVYEAFLSIVSRRIGDLLRIATGGTGILARGALHPDLVNRVTQETYEAAADVLQMCIRALDYCPPVDITFGEYLRAIVTADRDLNPDDAPGRRVAFMESFRNRGILPRDVRTVSEETLSWDSLDTTMFAAEGDRESWDDWLFDLSDDKELSLDWDLETDRQVAFDVGELNSWRMRKALTKLFARNPQFYAQFGLVPNLPRYDEQGTVMATRHDDEGDEPGRAATTTFHVSDVRPARRVKPNGSFRTDLIAVITQRRPELYDAENPERGFFWFRGGATVILNPREKKIRYIIVKNMNSRTRLERQRQAATTRAGSALRSLYFGEAAAFEPFAVMHSELGELTDG